MLSVSAHSEEPREKSTQCLQIVDARQAVLEDESETTEDEGKTKPDAEKSKPGKPKSRKLGIELVREVMPQDGSGFINDQAVQMLAEAQVNRMIKSGKATSLRELQEQFDRTSCQLNLVPENRSPVNSEMLYLNKRKSVVVVMISRKHNDHWHVVMAATGFMITSDGTMVTNRHVVRSTGTNADEYMFVMTSDARVHPVKAVLASNRANDAAICQVEGDGFHPVALRSNTPVGASARVISHPKGRLYTLTDGVVSRRYARAAAQRKRGDDEKTKLDLSKTTKWLTVTADFAKGSSGAPIFDRYGNVIGVATLTSNVTVEKDDDAISQMVFRDCVPAEVVMDMIEPIDAH